MEKYVEMQKTPGTRKQYRIHLKQFFNVVEANHHSYFQKNRDYEEDVEKFARFLVSLAPLSRKSKLSTVRGFLERNDVLFSKYFWKDLKKFGWGTGVQTLDYVPTAKDIKKILSKIDRNTDIGRRDYAIIMLLATYGVRGGQVRKLCLEDIDWKQNQIYFKPMKNGKRIIAPLTEDVGLSLLDYLQHSRPSTPYKEIFIISFAPYHPIYAPSIISVFIRRRMEEAGVKISPCGSHTFRHGFATSMLKKGHSLKTIADMIGHRSIHSTFIYTKVDFQALKQVPLDWPEVK